MGKKKSIITTDLERCIVCGRPYVDMHHVFGGSYRQMSDKYKLIVPLCVEHHTGPNGAHFNKALDLELKAIGQKKFEEVYRKSFIEVFGKNFI